MKQNLQKGYLRDVGVVWLVSGKLLISSLSSNCQSIDYTSDFSGNLIARTNSIAAAPSIINEPSVEISDSGSSASFAVTVSAPSAATFQWRFNGVNISGATNANLLLNNLTGTNKGAYSVVVSNASGVVTSSVARLLFNFDQIKVWGDNSDYEYGVPNGINQNAQGLVDGTADVVGITAGNGRTFAVKADGNIIGWGINNLSQSATPAGLSNVVQVVLGNYHQAALKSDGTVSAWGSDNALGLTNVPTGLSNVISLAMGYYHILALKADGTIVGWGDNTYSQITIPPLLSLDAVVAVAAGRVHSLALKVDGTVVGWGYNVYGQATIPSGATNVIAIAAGQYHSLALRSDGTVMAWGYNNFGQTNIPAGLSNVIAISTSYDHNMALRADGTVVSWGANGNGQTVVPTLTSNVVAISAGYTHSVALMGADANELAPTILKNSVWLGVMSNSFTARIYTKNRATSFSATGLPSGLSINPLTGTFTGAPTVSGVFNVTVTAANEAGTNQASFVMTIIRPLPKVYSPTSALAYTGNGFNYQVLANYDPTSYGASGLPPGLNINSASGLVSGTPQAVGVFPVLLSATNNYGGGGQYPLSIKVETIASWGANTYGQTNSPIGLSNVVAISAGDGHNLALSSNGTMTAWGYNGYGQTNVPAGLSNVVAIATGDIHSTALKGDGTVVAWGYNGNGQTTVPAVLSNVVAIDSQYRHNLALRSDGTVAAWGYNNNGETNVPGSLNAAVAVAAGYFHSLALQANGTVAGWGENTYGEATAPAGLSNVVAIAAGDYHSLALKRDGTVTAWGYNGNGQTNVPAGLSNVVAIAAEYRTSFALKSDGSMVFWGYNQNGQTNIPAGLTNVTAISSGGLHSLALTAGEPGVAGPMIVSSRQAVGAKGADFNYRVIAKNGPAVFGATGLPAGLTMNPTNGLISGIPTTNGIFNVTLSAGNLSGTNQSTLSLSVVVPLPTIYSATNAVGFAGNGFSYQTLANNGPTNFIATGLPAGLSLNATNGLISGAPLVSGLIPVTLAAVNEHGTGTVFTLTLEIRTIAGWGDNTYGQTNAPVGLSNVVAVAAGELHNIALRSDGAVIGWGNNTYNQTNVPSSVSNIIAISSGNYHNIALRDNGTLATWGYNGQGQTNVPAGLSNVVAIGAGERFSLAIKNDGAVVAWGNNAYGQINVPGSLNAAVAVAGGYYHTLALQANGAVVAWGYGGDGQTNVPAGLSNVVAIAAGERHNLALKSDGTVAAWGYNSNGQTNVPASLSNVVAISAGYRTSYALRSDGRVVLWGLNTDGQTNPPTGLTNVAAIAEGVGHSLAVTALEPGVAGPMIVSQGTAVGALGANFNYRVRVKNGATFYSASGLPPGLTINPLTGMITGTPTTNGSFLVTINAGNSSATNQTSLTVTVVRPLPNVYTTNFVVGVVRNPFAFQVAAANNPTNFGGVGLPPGLALNPTTGLITGFPESEGTFNVSLTATNAYGSSTSSLTIVAQSVVEWGLNTYLQSDVPLNLTNVVAIAGGLHHTVALLADGRVRSWGYFGYTNVPVNLSNVVQVTAGETHTLARKSDGTLTGWGLNAYGQTNSPPGLGLTNIISVAAGSYHNLALRADGKVLSWGYNQYGQTNVPAGLSNVVQVAAGDGHSLALRLDGSVVAWGNNANTQTNVPVSASNIVQIAAGGYHNLALKSDGTIIGWGYNGYGQNNVPTNLLNVVAIAAGLYHSAALRSNGTVVVWGYTGYDLTLVPSGLTNVLSIASGQNHIAAITSLPRPVLAIDTIGTSAFISWPAWAAGFTLQSSTSLSLTDSWGVVTSPIIIDGNRLIMEQNLTSGSRFYRLVRK